MAALNKLALLGIVHHIWRPILCFQQQIGQSKQYQYTRVVSSSLFAPRIPVVAARFCFRLLFRCCSKSAEHAQGVLLFRTCSYLLEIKPVFTTKNSKKLIGRCETTKEILPVFYSNVQSTIQFFLQQCSKHNPFWSKHSSRQVENRTKLISKGQLNK